MYPYKLRPTLNGEYAIIEFTNVPSQENFIEDFTAAIALLNPELLDKGAGISPNDLLEAPEGILEAIVIYLKQKAKEASRK